MKLCKEEKRQAILSEMAELQQTANLAIMPVPLSNNNQNVMLIEDLRKATDASLKIWDLQEDLYDLLHLNSYTCIPC